MKKVLDLLGRKLGLIDVGSPVARTLYAAAVAQARQPEFFEDLGVPNTVDGRFDAITLMVGLVVHRLWLKESQRTGLERHGRQESG